MTTPDAAVLINDEMVDAFNRAYSAVYEASAPITTQGEVVSVERHAVRAGIAAVLDALAAAEVKP